MHKTRKAVSSILLAAVSLLWLSPIYIILTNSFKSREEMYSNAIALPKGGGMWWDAEKKVFRLWYEAGWLNAIAYATSSNGVDFVRPNIHDGTNQVYPADERPDSWEVVPDYAAADPYSRWCLFLSGPGGDEPATLLDSKDGVWFGNRVLTGKCGDRSNFFYNPFRGKWNNCCCRFDKIIQWHLD